MADERESEKSPQGVEELAEDVEELADGVYVCPESIRHEGREYTYYLTVVETPRGVVLVDAGHEQAVDELGTKLAAIGHDWEDVTGVLLTHQDNDHVSALPEILERTDAVVYAHERAAPHVDGRRPLLDYSDERYPPVDVDVELVDGVSFRTDAGPMEVVFTPGHMPDHCSLYFPDANLLVAADAVFADDGELVVAHPHDEDEAADSVDRLADLDFDRVLCYHGGLLEAGPDRMRDLAESL